MHVLVIEYIRGGALFASTEGLSVEIDGSHVGVIPDRKDFSVELSDGLHEIVVRAGHCKKVIELQMDGDDRFIVSWDWVLGGLMVCDVLESKYQTGKRRYYWFYVILVALILIHISIMGLHYGGFFSDGLFISLESTFLAASLMLLVIVLAIRGRKVVRTTG
ncbi:MAG: hypothetical protein IKR86_02785 [Candidatus Methanomethylophilaceae archaeon]|nr:hypothetical protein [Candidatus Methanomethylophilaceae archaeon]